MPTPQRCSPAAGTWKLSVESGGTCVPSDHTCPATETNARRVVSVACKDREKCAPLGVGLRRRGDRQSLDVVLLDEAGDQARLLGVLDELRDVPRAFNGR